jgi:hypothetical protein
VTSIGAYLQVARKTMYQILKRWIEEGVRGLEDKSHANTNRQPTVDLWTRNTIRKLQANPRFGRVPHAYGYVDTCNPVEHLFVLRTGVHTKGASDP